MSTYKPKSKKRILAIKIKRGKKIQARRGEDAHITKMLNADKVVIA